MKEYYQNLLSYNYWAFNALLDAAASLSVVPETLSDLLGHAIITEKLWLQRISGATQNPPPVWPKMNIEETKELLAINRQMCESFLDDLAEADFNRSVTYKNSSGMTYTNTIQDILLHICMHANYHRGQANKMLREFGGTPVVVDYIAYKR